jgi:ribonuclease D
MAEVIYLDAEDDVAGFLDSIGAVTDLAVDTEGASFHRFVDRVYLLQFSTLDRHAILDPLAVAPPAALGALLADPDVEVVFHDADYDLRLLRQDFAWRVERLFDTRIAAQLLGIRQFGLASLLEANFGVRLDKRHQRADWSMRPLSEAMLAYAAQDTRHLLPLRDVFREQLARKGREGWAAEEFTRVQGVEWDANDSESAFLRVKGARDLARRELATLRELVRWRDQAAAAVDRAAFRVMANEALLEIARTAPASVEALRSVKGIPRNLSPTRTAEVLAAVQAGLGVPEEDLPKFPRAPRWDRDPHFDTRVSALRTARDAVAAKLDLEPGVLCSRERLEAVARRVPASPDDLSAIPELRRWQVEVFGDELLRALKRS